MSDRPVMGYRVRIGDKYLNARWFPFGTVVKTVDDKPGDFMSESWAKYWADRARNDGHLDVKILKVKRKSS